MSIRHTAAKAAIQKASCDAELEEYTTLDTLAKQVELAKTLVCHQDGEYKDKFKIATKTPVKVTQDDINAAKAFQNLLKLCADKFKVFSDSLKTTTFDEQRAILNDSQKICASDRGRAVKLFCDHHLAEFSQMTNNEQQVFFHNSRGFISSRYYANCHDRSREFVDALKPE